MKWGYLISSLSLFGLVIFNIIIVVSEVNQKYSYFNPEMVGYETSMFMIVTGIFVCSAMGIVNFAFAFEDKSELGVKKDDS